MHQIITQNNFNTLFRLLEEGNLRTFWGAKLSFRTVTALCFDFVINFLFFFFYCFRVSDGSDHRACCSDRGVPRRCLEWCRGEPVNNKMCVLSYSKSILACFDELRGMFQNYYTLMISASYYSCFNARTRRYFMF
jgi:hypothetical protein